MLGERSEQNESCHPHQKNVFCFTESFVPPWTRIQDMIGNTVKENIDDIKYDILDDHMLG